MISERISLMQSLLMLTILAAPAPLPKPVPVRPGGLPPLQAEVTWKDGALFFRSVVTEYRTETRLRKRNGPGGNPITEPYTVTVPVFIAVEQKIETKKATIYRA